MTDRSASNRRPLSVAIAAALITTAGLAACSSTAPIRFHTLVAPTPPTAALPAPATVPLPAPATAPLPTPATALRPSPAVAPATRPSPFLIEVLPVGVPAQLDQPQLVIRQDDSSLVVSENERWAGPLADELREALSAELTHRLATRDIAGLGRPGAEPVMRIKVQVRRLDAWLDRRIQLDADWSLDRIGADAATTTDASEAGRLTCGGRFEVAADPGYPGLVRAQQQALARLAARIAADARARDHGGAARCTVAANPG